MGDGLIIALSLFSILFLNGLAIYWHKKEVAALWFSGIMIGVLGFALTVIVLIPIFSKICEITGGSSAEGGAWAGGFLGVFFILNGIIVFVIAIIIKTIHFLNHKN